MLNKFISIKNVGRFTNCGASGDVDFRKLTLIFAGNGQGKTTLCSILRSLQTDDKNYILERKTRGQTNDPAVNIRIHDTNTKFDSNGWSVTIPDIAIYDSEFVHENIYAGDFVVHEQKKRLYRVMIGKKGVEFARIVDRLDEKGKALAKEVRTATTTLKAYVPGSMEIDDFIGLKPKDGIDEAIEAKSADIDALRQASEIKSKATLSKIHLPLLPSDFYGCLALELEGISSDVEQHVQTHIKEHTKSATTSWLAKGLDFTKEEECPYCGQDTSGIDIIKAYKTIFGNEYAKLKDRIAALQASINAALDEAARFKCDRTEFNQGLFNFWSKFCKIDLPELDFPASVRPTLTSLHSLASKFAGGFNSEAQRRVIKEASRADR